MTIDILRRHFETLRRGEISRFRRRLGGLNPEQEDAIESLTSGIVEKILRGPSAVLKGGQSESESHDLEENVRRIFALQYEHQARD